MHAHAKEFLTFLVSLLHVCVRLHSPRTAGTSVARAGGIFSRIHSTTQTRARGWRRRDAVLVLPPRRCGGRTRPDATLQSFARRVRAALQRLPDLQVLRGGTPYKARDVGSWIVGVVLWGVRCARAAVCESFFFCLGLGAQGHERESCDSRGVVDLVSLVGALLLVHGELYPLYLYYRAV